METQLNSARQAAGRKKNLWSIVPELLSTGRSLICAGQKPRASVTGAGLEQVRIDETDYVRPNRTYPEESGRHMVGADRQRCL
ncbi:hypothetical protein GCM10017779_11340 [Streptomyces capillispiralis]|nr:hypothetical protein GCM10017779_11340 [Streptomyces capillispiralis]